MNQTITRLQHAAHALGFDTVAFVHAADVPSVHEPLQHWLHQGYAGSMTWLADKAAWRAHPTALWPSVQTIMCLGMSYAPEVSPLQHLIHKDRGNISVYARGRDYHDVIKGKLKQLAPLFIKEGATAVKVFVDTAPVAEKNLAQAAQLGTVGKHTNLIHKKHGNWLFLSEIFTDLTLNIAQNAPKNTQKNPACGTCTRCLDICPTRAFVAPYVLDARRCISYLTIEYAGIIPLEFHAAMGNRIYGCDDCLAVCPWNKFATPHTQQAFASAPHRNMPLLNTLLQLDDAAFRQFFSQSPIKRIGRNRFIRNVLIAAANSGDKSLLPLIDSLTTDDCEVVRTTAHISRTRLQQA